MTFHQFGVWNNSAILSSKLFIFLGDETNIMLHLHCYWRIAITGLLCMSSSDLLTIVDGNGRQRYCMVKLVLMRSSSRGNQFTIASSCR